MPDKLSLKELIEENTMPSAPELMVREKDDAVRCLACGHRCFIRPGKAGVCRVRFNRNGQLLAPGGYVAGLQVDPIEKKPFFHAYPGRDALSFGMLGCDFHCAYCQNWVSSQVLRDESATAMPHICDEDALVACAVERHVPVVVSTYNEPLITADWAVKVFDKARARGLVCGFVSNGNATPEVLAYIRPYVDLYKVDLKSFDDANYRKLGGVLRNVLDTIVRLKEMGFWVEIVTLVVPGFNDGQAELEQMARFIAGVSRDIPWHVTAFHPDYRMTEPGRTTRAELDRACAAGKEAGLRFVYEGNLPGAVGERENTCCPQCGTLLIRRYGFLVIENTMRGNRCPECEAEIPGVWEHDPPRRSDGPGIPSPIWLR